MTKGNILHSYYFIYCLHMLNIYQRETKLFEFSQDSNMEELKIWKDRLTLQWRRCNGFVTTASLWRVCCKWKSVFTSGIYITLVIEIQETIFISIMTYICIICLKIVNRSDNAILCDQCDNWIPIKYNNQDKFDYEMLKSTEDFWFCIPCTSDAPHL